MATDRAGTEDTWPIIALVASAGGIDALIRALGPLPATIAAGFLVLLHIAPDQESALPDILARGCSLEVRSAADGDVITPGQVLVAPPGCQTLIGPDLRIALITSGPYPPSRPSADLLLTTLALSAGPRAVAVVLSGQGHDGATGATAVHRFGGTVLATDQASSQAFSMPSATIQRDNAIDHIVHLDQLGDRLAGLAGA
jgi:two-component system, chemotaxis family, protein-glutamate methylesterase/glutaminase